MCLLTQNSAPARALALAGPAGLEDSALSLWGLRPQTPSPCRALALAGPAGLEDSAVAVGVTGDRRLVLAESPLVMADIDSSAHRDRDASLAVIDAPVAPATVPTERAPGDDLEVVGDDDGRTRPPGRQPSALANVGRRVIRRPWEWARSPWPTPRILTVVTTVVALAFTTIVMMNVVHFNPFGPLNPFSGPDLVLDNNTPTGGDMGSHVWGPAFLRDHLLPNFQLSGWSMDWYAGMPVYRFYMVVPALAIVALDALPFMPYGVAFKLVAISGLVALPLCCWAFGRLARFRYPMPELFAFAGMAFALQESYSIYGGNLQSTMAGEFSFSIALSLCILGLGLLARGMETGQYRSWAAIVLALAMVSHGIVAIYTAVAALIVVAVNIDSLKRFWYGACVGLGVILLSAFWIGPFVGNHAFMTDMKYGKRPEGAADSFWDMFFPFPAPLDVAITGLALIGFVACIARRHVNGAALGVIGLFTVAGVYLFQDSLPIIGLLWNPRLLPMLYLVEFLLMMVGIIETAGVVVALFRNRQVGDGLGVVPGLATFGATALAVALIFGFFYESLPFGGQRTENGQNVYAWGPLRKNAHPDDSDSYQRARGPGWAKYNFNGYEGRPKYPEYHDIVQTMDRIGATNGCGRASWENNGDNGEYGTTMALMLLPFWTDGCIASMEGLFFEASGTTPYHFLTTAAMSKQSSNPVRELRYTNNDADVGVRHLQTLGVRYAMVRTEEAKREAGGHEDLTLLDTVGPWEIYQVADADVVVPLAVQPVVVEGRSGDQRERNLELGTSWFQQPDEWAALPADDGPEDWQRIEAVVDESRLVPDPNRSADDPDTRGEQVDIVVPSAPIQTVDLPAVQVTDVEMEQQALSFRVDQIGVPVLVKVSYFPNWAVDGADGPYRVAPNFMVVVPTEQEVRLHHDRSSSDLLFYVLTLAGIGLLVFFRFRGDLDMTTRFRRYATPCAPTEAVDPHPSRHDAAGGVPPAAPEYPPEPFTTWQGPADDAPGASEPTAAGPVADEIPPDDDIRWRPDPGGEADGPRSSENGERGG